MLLCGENEIGISDKRFYRQLIHRSDARFWWDTDGMCLFAKRLERGRFVWPQASTWALITDSSVFEPVNTVKSG